MPIENTIFGKTLIVPFNHQERIRRYRYVSRAEKIIINNLLLLVVCRYAKRLDSDGVQKMFVHRERIYQQSYKGCRAGPRAEYLQVRRLVQLLNVSSLVRSSRLYRCRKLIQVPKIHPGNQRPISHDRDGRECPTCPGQFIFTDDGMWVVVAEDRKRLQMINVRPFRDRIYNCTPLFPADFYSYDVMAEQIVKVTNKNPCDHHAKERDERPDPSKFEGYEEEGIPASRIVQIVNKPPDRNQGYLILATGGLSNNLSNDLSDPEDDLDDNYI